MRSFLLFLVAGIIFSGCNSQQTSADPMALETFPKELAGVWKLDTGGKAFEFDEEGNLVSFTYAAGLKINVDEGGISMPGQSPGSMLILVLGETPVEYDAVNRVLKVTVNFDDYTIQVPGGSLSGQMTKVIEGKVSEDWNEWLATSIITGTVENLPQMDDDTETLYRFRKAQ